MSKVINNIELSSGTLELSECTDGFWLYDDTRGMIVIRAKTERDAFVEALEYYQERLTTVECLHRTLHKKVDAFVSQCKEEDE